jgi:HEAT repeat protein
LAQQVITKSKDFSIAKVFSMISERRDQEQQPPEREAVGEQQLQRAQRESIRAALALLLGPETDYHIRVRATRRLARKGPAILPLLLTTLSTYPEITSPPWPWWPPQYEHCSRLLIYLSQKAQMGLEAMLHHPSVVQPTGPVLWISIIEAAGLLPHADNYEELLCKGLELPWITVRYAAAMALATRARKVSLQKGTLDQLRTHLSKDEALPVRLTASYALLSSGENAGLDVLLQLMDPLAPEEARKAAAFILATELPIPLFVSQCERLTEHLLRTLKDTNRDLALYAAQALSKIALPPVLSSLSEMLTSDDAQIQTVVLVAIEDLARHTKMRRAIRQQAIPTRILPLLKNGTPDVRRQASCTLAVCGGEYVTAVLGTIVLNKDHPGHLEAIESLRFLHGALRAPTRMNVVRWLLRLLSQSQEEIQVTALDSLLYLLWQARIRKQNQAWQDITQEIICDGTIEYLLDDSSAWVRQRTIELLKMLGSQFNASHSLHRQLLHLLHTDSDSGVRACAAYACEQLAARWAIPDLIQSLFDCDEHVAQTAFNALSQLATPDDAIVVYVLTELTHYADLQHQMQHHLAQAAQTLLKKWQKQGFSKVLM